ncbi:MAG: DUF1223 domain-containing protein [Rhodospirillales bacterium]|nr:DUF1223 domain-containing protein [Rhodospirillales bacterium]
MRGAITAAVWLVTFLDRRSTVVRAGENRGKTLVNRRVVMAAEPVGEWNGTARTFDVPVTLADGEGCAVIVQSRAPGPVLGAAVCPKTGS